MCQNENHSFFSTLHFSPQKVKRSKKLQKYFLVHSIIKQAEMLSRKIFDMLSKMPKKHHVIIHNSTMFHAAQTIRNEKVVSSILTRSSKKTA